MKSDKLFLDNNEIRQLFLDCNEIRQVFLRLQ
jgi:hypothetical protein